MTLKVGEVYRIMFACGPESVVITRIELFRSGRAQIHFKHIVCVGLPRSYSDGAYRFVNRMKQAKRMDKESAPEKSRSAREVEVKYR